MVEDRHIPLYAIVGIVVVVAIFLVATGFSRTNIMSSDENLAGKAPALFAAKSGTKGNALPPQPTIGLPKLLEQKVAIATPTNRLEIEEPIRFVVPVIDKDDLDILKNGQSYTAYGMGATTVQTLSFDDPDLGQPSGEITGRVIFDRDQRTDIVGDYLFFGYNNYFVKYNLAFQPSLQVMKSEEGALLFDLVHAPLSMLGVKYIVLDATYISPYSWLTLQLLSGTTPTAQDEGTTVQYIVQGEPYDVTVLNITLINQSSWDSCAELSINGILTQCLSPRMTDILPNGLRVSMHEVYGDEYGPGYVNFSLGGSLVTIQDNIADSAYSYSLEVKGIDAGSTLELQDVSIIISADAAQGSHIFMPSGKRISTIMDEPQALLGGRWDIEYTGLMTPPTSTMRLFHNSEASYMVQFTNSEGKQYTIPLVDTSNSLKMGDANNMLWLEEAAGPTNYIIKTNDMFVTFRQGGTTNVFRHLGVNYLDQVITLQDMAGGIQQVTYTGTPGVNAYGTLVLGPGQFDRFTIFVGGNSTNGSLAADFTGDDIIVWGNRVPLCAKGMCLLASHANNGYLLYGALIVSMGSPVESGSPDSVGFNISDEGDRLHLEGYWDSPISFEEGSNIPTNHLWGMDTYGNLFDYDVGEGGSYINGNELTVIIPNSQRFAKAYVVGRADPVKVD
jgi:hypothetical protein